ncbi:MAG: hypothetical protein WBL40_12795 [Terrimicrobiaceae bacterium]
MADREDRAYKTTDLPTLRESTQTPAERELLLKLYEQTCTTWRMLVDVRFKLVALVPTLSLISLATVFGGGDATKYFSPKLRLLFACLGLVVTLGLLIYELRNSQLHDDLISRGRKIEDELGVDTGVFRGRKVAKGIIKHDHAIFLIYGAALVAWLAAIWTTACAH